MEDTVKYIVSPRSSYGLIKLNGDKVEAFEPCNNPIDYMWIVDEDGEVNTHEGVVKVYAGDLVMRTYIDSASALPSTMTTPMNHRSKKTSMTEKVIVFGKDDMFNKIVTEYKRLREDEIGIKQNSIYETATCGDPQCCESGTNG